MVSTRFCAFLKISCDDGLRELISLRNIKERRFAEVSTMAFLWVINAVEEAPSWAVVPLKGAKQVELQRGEPVPATPLREKQVDARAALLQQYSTGRQDQWVLLAPKCTPVAVNGLPVLAGIKVLQDRDEIRFVGTNRRIFYSTERLVRIEEFGGSEREISCPRCKQEIQEGSGVVRCPQCDVVHHQTEGLSCWTYSNHCSLCDQPTALDAGYRWTPAGL
jgi:hypothetical protein